MVALVEAQKGRGGGKKQKKKQREQHWANSDASACILPDSINLGSDIVRLIRGLFCPRPEDVAVRTVPLLPNQCCVDMLLLQRELCSFTSIVADNAVHVRVVARRGWRDAPLLDRQKLPSGYRPFLGTAPEEPSLTNAALLQIPIRYSFNKDCVPLRPSSPIIQYMYKE